jgi:hypothetical protein
MTTQLKINRQQPVEITWEPLPAGFRLEDEPVENTGQPLIAAELKPIETAIGCGGGTSRQQSCLGR